MKAVVSLFCTLLLPGCLCGSLSAQTWAGFKGGYTLSQTTFEPDIDIQRQSGILAGLVLKQSAKPNVGLQAELNFSQKGWIETFDDFGTRTAAFRYNYLELPIMTNIYLGRRRVQYFLNLGPFFSYLLSADSTFNKLPDDTPTYSFSERTAINFEYGLAAGLGVNVKIGQGMLMAEARLAIGLNNAIDRDATDAPLGSQNQAAQFSLSWLFDAQKLFKKKNPPEGLPPVEGFEGEEE